MTTDTTLDSSSPSYLTIDDIRSVQAQIGARLYYLNREIEDALSGALVLQGPNGPMLPIEAAREVINRFWAWIGTIVADLNRKGIEPDIPPEYRGLPGGGEGIV